MFNEELLQFIREQRKTGMEKTELDRLLITEGGWDEADVQDAYRALEAPALSLIAPEPVGLSAAPSSPFSGLEITSSPDKRAREEEENLGGVLSVASHEEPLANTKISHENFLGLFSRRSTAEGEAPAPKVAVTDPTRSPAPSFKPVTFNLSALRQISTQNAAATPRVSMPMPALGQTIGAPSEKKPSAPPGPMERVSGTGSISSVHETDQQTAKSKTSIMGRRTMATDLLAVPGAANKDMAPRVSGTISVPPPFIEVRLLETEKTDQTPKEEINISAPATTALGFSPFQEDAIRTMHLRLVLYIMLGIVSIGLIFGGVFALMQLHTSDSKLLLRTAFEKFFAVSSLRYGGQAMTDLTFSAPLGGIVENGAMKFLLKYEGELANGKEGYGDGTHTIALSGGWQWRDSLLSTDMRSDIRAVGQSLYFHILSLPKTSEIDPAWIKDNWLKVDYSELAKQLRISGVTSVSEQYGSFGGTSGEAAFNTLFRKSFPLQSTGAPVKETVNGKRLSRIHVVVDPGPASDLLRALYQKYSNQDLTFSENELLRFKGALAKLSGDVWVDAQTGTLAKIILTANFDDDIAGVRVRGPLNIEFSFPAFNQPVSVSAPTGILPLADLNVKTAEYKALKEMRERDQTKLDHAGLLTKALENYFIVKRRYPKTLTDLYGAGALATSSMSIESLRDYSYRSYQKAGVFSKSSQCTATGKICEFYHLGVNLEDIANEALKGDSDQTTAIFGDDRSGCGGELKYACYDLVSPAILPGTDTPAPSSASVPPTSAPKH